MQLNGKSKGREENTWGVGEIVLWKGGDEDYVLISEFQNLSDRWLIPRNTEKELLLPFKKWKNFRNMPLS